MTFLKKYFLSWILVLVVLVIWQVISSAGFIPAFLLPSPVAILQAFSDFSSDLGSAFCSTFINALTGLVLTSLLGSLLSLLIVLVPALEKSLLPFFIFFQTVPIVAIAPLLVIWFGFGSQTVIICSLIVGFFPVVANNLQGLTGINQDQIDLFRIYRASRFKVMTKLQIPSALPAFFTGLKISSGLCVIGCIVGEFVAGGGLGGLIDSARTQQRVDLVFASLILSTLCGLIFILFIELIKKLVNENRPYLLNR